MLIGWRSRPRDSDWVGEECINNFRSFVKGRTELLYEAKWVRFPETVYKLDLQVWWRMNRWTNERMGPSCFRGSFSHIITFRLYSLSYPFFESLLHPIASIVTINRYASACSMTQMNDKRISRHHKCTFYAIIIALPMLLRCVYFLVCLIFSL